MEMNIEITAAYLSQTPRRLENGLTASTNPSSAPLNRLFNNYASPPCSNSSLPPCKQFSCKQSPSSNLDLDACLKKGYCRLFSHCFNVLLEYNSEIGASEISPSLCFTISGDLTWVTLGFISTHPSTAQTVRGRSSLHGSCTP